jgi:hypothetical protein
MKKKIYCSELNIMCYFLERKPIKMLNTDFRANIGYSSYYDEFIKTTWTMGQDRNPKLDGYLLNFGL